MIWGEIPVGCDSAHRPSGWRCYDDHRSSRWVEDVTLENSDMRENVHDDIHEINDDVDHVMDREEDYINLIEESDEQEEESINCFRDNLNIFFEMKDFIKNLNKSVGKYHH